MFVECMKDGYNALTTQPLSQISKLSLMGEVEDGFSLHFGAGIN